MHHHIDVGDREKLLMSTHQVWWANLDRSWTSETRDAPPATRSPWNLEISSYIHFTPLKMLLALGYVHSSRVPYCL